MASVAGRSDLRAGVRVVVVRGAAGLVAAGFLAVVDLRPATGLAAGFAVAAGLAAVVAGFGFAGAVAGFGVAGAVAGFGVAV